MKLLVKTTILILTVTLSYSFQATAQEEVKRDREEMMAERYLKMQQVKIAYITEHLDLSIEEAEKFWPVYRKYEAKRNEITSDLFKRFEGPEKKAEELTNEEALERIQQRLKEERALVELKYQSLNSYLEVIPATKVYKLFEVENNFRRHLMERMKDKQDERKREMRGAKAKPMQEPTPRR